MNIHHYEGLARHRSASRRPVIGFLPSPPRSLRVTQQQPETMRKPRLATPGNLRSTHLRTTLLLLGVASARGQKRWTTSSCSRSVVGCRLMYPCAEPIEPFPEPFPESFSETFLVSARQPIRHKLCAKTTRTPICSANAWSSLEAILSSNTDDRVQCTGGVLRRRLGRVSSNGKFPGILGFNVRVEHITSFVEEQAELDGDHGCGGFAN